MKGIKLLITIVPRGKGEEASLLCREKGITFSMISPAYGAAGTHFMDYLGLTNPEKDCVLSVVQAEFSHPTLSLIHSHFRMDEPNSGIALTISITGVSGPRALRYISGIYPPPASSSVPPKNDGDQTGKESEKMKASHIPADVENKNAASRGQREFDLIVTIVNRGFSDLAIEAAKDVGVKGATVLYARGTGAHEVEKFFAIAIQPEKEIILTLVRHNTTKNVMHAIIDAAGLQTEGRGLCFSLPVDEVAGIVHWMKGGENAARDIT